ncbi:MAG: hypothetical protein LIP23_04160, partial [Planctomycetes bacterium]|nr:hypothetical protein [Planctomycetota bacterium]
MSPKMRKVMADNERLKTLAMQEQTARRGENRRYDRFFYIAAILWAVVAALPSIYIARPLPYMVGSTSPNNVYSRVDFRWRDAATETL